MSDQTAPVLVNYQMKIHCDACNHEFPVKFDDVPKYHNKECDICHSAILVDDEDMLAYEKHKDILVVLKDLESSALVKNVSLKEMDATVEQASDDEYFKMSITVNSKKGVEIDALED